MAVRAVSWGLLASVALPALSACSANPPAVASADPPATRPVGPAAPVSSNSPKEPPPGRMVKGNFGPFVPLSTESAPTAPSSHAFFEARTGHTFFGQGSLQWGLARKNERSDKNCPIQDSPQNNCGVATLTVSDQELTEDLWRTGEAPSKSAPRTLRIPFAKSWASFAGGRDGIYLKDREASTLERMDDKGQIHPFLDHGMPPWDLFTVVEVGERRFVIGQSEGKMLQVGEAVVGADKKRTLGPLTELGMAAVPRAHQNADGARRIEEGKKRPLYGPLVAIPTKDEKRGHGWALVWVEALPPPPRKQSEMSSRELLFQIDPGNGEINLSPLLASRSVGKRFHVTRFEGVKQTSDKVVLSTPDYDADRSPFFVRPTGKGIEINGVTYDRNGKKIAARAVKTAPVINEQVWDEKVLAADLDASSGEGAVVYWSDDHARWRKFDAQGKPKGPPITLKGDAYEGFSFYSDVHTQESELRLSSSGGRWLLWTLPRGRVLELDRELVSNGIRSPVGFSPGGPSPVVLELQEGRLVSARLDPDPEGYAAPTEPVTTPPGDSWLVPLFTGAKAEFSLLGVRNSWKEMSGPLSVGAALQVFRPSSGWAELKGAIPHEIGTPTELSLHQVWGDVVVVVTGIEARAATWLAAGQTVLFPNQLGESRLDSPELARHLVLGPLLDGGGRMLPAKPGPLLETPELEEISNNCQRSMLTAPGTLTFVCRATPYRDKPGIRVGLMSYHFHE